MRYANIVEATFINRPNRFIAYCELEGETVKCHVKNTGQCNQLLNRGSVPEWCCSTAEKA